MWILQFSLSRNIVLTELKLFLAVPFLSYLKSILRKSVEIEVKEQFQGYKSDRRRFVFAAFSF